MIDLKTLLLDNSLVLLEINEWILILFYLGHTHNDHIESVESVEGEKRGVGTVFIAPSGTTYSY